MRVISLDDKTYKQAEDLLFELGLDSREEIQHHLDEKEKYFIAIKNDEVIGVIGWYQDNVNYAKDAMGDDFPGEDAYWIGFFGVKREFQNQGVGENLINELEKILRSKDVSELWVSSVPEAVGYYKKNDFVIQIEGEISGNPKVFLKKKLIKL